MWNNYINWICQKQIPRLPENHNFCTTNLESKYSSLYNNEKQTIEKDRKKYLFDKILDNSIDKLQLLYNHYKDNINTNKLKKMEKVINEINQIKTLFMNNKIKKEIFNEINLISYNNKDLIKNTWDSDKKHINTFEDDLEQPLTDDEYFIKKQNNNNNDLDSDSDSSIVTLTAKNN